jgi:hypothetical protein
MGHRVSFFPALTNVVDNMITSVSPNVLRPLRSGPGTVRWAVGNVIPRHPGREFAAF